MITHNQLSLYVPPSLVKALDAIRRLFEAVYRWVQPEQLRCHQSQLLSGVLTNLDKIR